MEIPLSLNSRCSTCHNHLPQEHFDIKKTGEYLKTCRMCLSSKSKSQRRPVAAPIRNIVDLRQGIIAVTSSIYDPQSLAQLLTFALSIVPLQNQTTQNRRSSLSSAVPCAPPTLPSSGTFHTTSEVSTAPGDIGSNLPQIVDPQV